MTDPTTDDRRRTLSGLGMSIGSYLLWGLLPAYFVILAPTGAFEVVAWRVLFSLVFCALLMTLTGGWRRFASVARDRRTLFTIALAAVLIYVNWQVFLLATLSGRVVDAALGYFINPIVTVLLGVLLLGERLRPVQWVAIGLSGVAVAVVAIGSDGVPWTALLLAFSFGFYGYVKSRLKGRVDALSSLTLETAWLTPVAIVQLFVVSAVSGGLVFGRHSVTTTLLLVSAGVITAVPLLLFGGAVRRLPLSVIGLTQYLTPVLQFLTGVLLLAERMQPVRWIGFAVVWVALVVLTVDGLRAARRSRPDAAALPVPAPVEPI